MKTFKQCFWFATFLFISYILIGHIDLHGLHISEAIDCLNELLPSITSNGSRSSISIITGSGHHTLGPQKGSARLLPVIKSFLTNLNLNYKDILDDNGYVGALLVNLSNLKIK